MLKNSIQLAFRHLLRYSSFSLINVGGLAISLASCIFIFYFVYDEFTYDRFHKKSDRIYRITQLFKTNEDTQNLLWTHQKLGPYLKRVYPQVEEFVRIEDVKATFNKTQKEEKGIVRTDASIFNIFTYPLIEGNPNTALREPHTIVISKALSEKYFHGMALGQTVDIENEPYEVTGVMDDVPENSDKWISGMAHGDFGGEEDARLYFTYQTYILLREGEDPAFIRSELSKVSETLHRKSGPVEFGFDMQALEGLHFFTGTGMDNPKGNEISTKILTVVALVLLMVALFNFINLTTVVSLERAKEVGVRKVAGAQKVQLIRQFLSESSVAVFIAVVIGLMFVMAMNTVFSTVSGKHISFSSEGDLMIIGSIVLLLILTAVSSSIYPAWILSSYKPVKALRNENLHMSKGGLVRKLLTTLQFGLSTTLLIFLTTVLFQTDFMRTTDPGFNKDKIMVVKIPDDSVSRAHTDFYVGEFMKVNSVSQVAIGGFGSAPGTTDVVASPVTISVNGEQREPVVGNIDADRNYTSMLGLNAIVGSSLHDLKGQDIGGKAVINQSFAVLADWTNPIGESIHTYGGDAVIVGVIPDFHFKSLHNKIDPLVIMGQPDKAHRANNLFIKTTSTDIDELKSAWHKMNPDHPFQYSFLNEYVDAQYQSEKTLQAIFLYFTLVTLLIAASGLFGLAIHHVEKKTKEISIRKVLGAGVFSLIQLLSKEFSLLTGVGIIVGTVAGSIVSNRWLTGFAYHIEPDFKTMLLPVLTMVLISVAILVYRTYRGSSQNPVKGLKYE